MIEELENIFKREHNLDVKHLQGKILVFRCKTVKNNDYVTFIGEVGNDALYLPVNYPYYINTEGCFCAGTGVSPNFDNPRAYYILNSWWLANEDEVKNWNDYKEEFVDSLKTYYDKGRIA